MPDDLLPELKALVADITVRLDRAVAWVEVRGMLTRRLQAAAHAEVDDPLAHAAVSALCRRLVGGSAGDTARTQVDRAGAHGYRAEAGGDELAASMLEWQLRHADRSSTSAIPPRRTVAV